MAAKLAQWYGCNDFRTWVNAFVSAYDNPNNFANAAKTSNTLLGLDVGMQLLQISTATAGVVVFCAVVTPEVFSFVVNSTKMGWNKMVSFITQFLPSGVTISINGILLAPII
jgi:imidazoleglycerol phosphate synthase glutamine amidotransferase subunit HisH